MELEKSILREKILTSPPVKSPDNLLLYQSMSSEKKLSQIEKMLERYNFSPPAESCKDAKASFTSSLARAKVKEYIGQSPVKRDGK